VNSLVSVLLSSSKTLPTSFAINCTKKDKNATNYNTGVQELQLAYKPDYYMTTPLYHRKNAKLITTMGHTNCNQRKK
jgi:hypothetical protein